MASIGAAIGYFYTSASAYNIMRKDKEGRLPKFISILGSLLSLGFVALLIIPGMPAYLTLPSRLALLIWVVLGLVFYGLSAKSYNKISKKELNTLIIKSNK